MNADGRPGAPKKQNPLIKISIQVPAWLNDQIADLAKEQDKSKSAVILDALLKIFKGRK